MENIINVMQKSGNLNNFLKIVKRSGHIDTLKNCHTFTVLAPVDHAFDNFYRKGVIDRKNRDELLRMLKKHILRGKVEFKKLIRGDYKTMLGKRVVFEKRDRQLNFIRKDIECENGIIHLVDSVIAG